MRKDYSLLVFLFIVITCILSLNLGCNNENMDEKEANKVLKDFYTDDVPESITDRHLLQAGKAIVPHLLYEVQNKDMPKRGYAILALGKMSDRRALPILKKIFEDKSEQDAIRGDALTAIWKIDSKIGEDLAGKYIGKNEYINRTIELLRKGLI